MADLDAKTIRRKGDKSKTEIIAISRHSERLAKESSDTNNLIQLQGIKINSTETDHVSMPLGIFASKSASDVGIAMPTYFKDLAAWLPSRLAAKKSAFTFAEVLITLGIIGVVAAMTIPSLVTNYKGKVAATQLKKGYSTISQALLMMYNDTGEVINYENYPNTKFAPVFKKYLGVQKYSDGQAITGSEKEDYYLSKEYMNYNNTKAADASLFDEGQMIINDNMAIYIQNSDFSDWLFITIDINGINKKPNRWGHDLFTFRVEGNGKLIPLADPKGDNFFKNKATYCSKTANNNRNGIACAYYAINDVCPDDNTKSYWKCLP